MCRVGRPSAEEPYENGEHQQGIAGGEDVVEHDAETAAGAFVHPADGRRFDDVEEAEDNEGGGLPGEISNIYLVDCIKTSTAFWRMTMLRYLMPASRVLFPFRRSLSGICPFRMPYLLRFLVCSAQHTICDIEEAVRVLVCVFESIVAFQVCHWDIVYYVFICRCGVDT